MPKQVRIGYRVDVNKIIVNIGRVYSIPPDVTAQGTENGSDAIQLLSAFDPDTEHPRHIWLVLDPDIDRLSNIDTGIGMVAELPKGSKPWKGKRDIGDLTETELTFLQSMERMVTSVGSSSKKMLNLKDQKGVKGVGALAVFQIARQTTFVSRPYHKMAPNYFGEGVNANQWLHILYTSLDEADELKAADPTIDYSDDLDLLVNPVTDERLPHGTRVTMCNLFEGVWEKLNPAQLAFFYSKRFASTLIEGKVRIDIVVIHRNREGEITEREVIPVNPPSWPGDKIYDEVLSLPSPWQHLKFRMELYYDPEATEKLPAVIRRKGGDTKISLASLPEFSKIAVFKDLGGYVDFPEVDDDENLWITNKGELANSRERQAWYRSIIKALPAIKAAKDRIDNLYDKDEARQDADELRQAVLAALEDLPELGGESFGSLHPTNEHKGKKKARSGEPKTPIQYVGVTVMDQYNRPISDIDVELWSNLGGKRLDKLVVKHKTRESGFIYFGIRPIGWYTMRVLPPKGMTPQGEPHATFQIRRDEESGVYIGRSQVFILNTDRPQYPEMPDITISFEPFRNHPDLPYMQQLEVGLVRINQIAPEYADAFERGDENKKLLLRALYMASAIAEYRTSKSQMGPEQALWQMNVLFPKIYSHLINNRSRKRKR